MYMFVPWVGVYSMFYSVSELVFLYVCILYHGRNFKPTAQTRWVLPVMEGDQIAFEG